MAPPPKLLSVAVFALWSSTYAQQLAPIEQQRLLHENRGPITGSAEAESGDFAPVSNTSDDESFGTQLILKKKERARTISITGDTSVLFTNNVELTRHDQRSDGFLVASAAIIWNPHLARDVDVQVAARTAAFRYFKTSSMDFSTLGLGVGIGWMPPQLHGLSIFARYDFTELLNRDGKEILRDHEFTLGMQKTFVLRETHAVTLGVTGTAGNSNPREAQRDEAALFATYHWQITRALETEVSYRFAGYFYDQQGRTDRNQVVSWNARYHVNKAIDVFAFASFAANRSTRTVFDYNVATSGAGVGVTVRF